jgi:hypothetical protein
MSAVRPEFIRLPEPKTNCPYTGYSRTGLYNLCVPCKANGFSPAVPARCDRKRGNLRGVWLIPYDELIAYIKALPTGIELRATNSATAVTAARSIEAGPHRGAKRLPVSAGARGRR